MVISPSVKLILPGQDGVVFPIVALLGHHVDDQADGEELFIPGRDADITAPQEEQWRGQLPCGAGCFFG